MTSPTVAFVFMHEFAPLVGVIASAVIIMIGGFDTIPELADDIGMNRRNPDQEFRLIASVPTRIFGEDFGDLKAQLFIVDQLIEYLFKRRNTHPLIIGPSGQTCQIFRVIDFLRYHIRKIQMALVHGQFGQFFLIRYAPKSLIALLIGQIFIVYPMLEADQSYDKKDNYRPKRQ
jgi:hypothetical protein